MKTAREIEQFILTDLGETISTRDLGNVAVHYAAASQLRWTTTGKEFTRALHLYRTMRTFLHRSAHRFGIQQSKTKPPVGAAPNHRTSG